MIYMSPVDLDAVLASLDDFVDISGEDLADVIEHVRDRSAAVLTSPQSRMDASTASDDEIRAWILGLPVPPEVEVVVVWPFDMRAVRITYGDFATHVSDFWYPSSDDVVVFPVNPPPAWMLIIDHEEQLAYG
jgi:hypothetical protein